MEFAKRDSHNPSQLMRLEYDMLSDKMKVLARKEPEGDVENYYTRRKGEIEMSWLSSSTDTDQNYVWHANMPISLWQSKEIFEAAKKMPKKVVVALVFPDYEMNSAEITLFDVIFEYGRAKGLEVVATQLYIGAENGDPRAVKMYLELMELIKTGDEDEDSRIKKLMRVSINI